MFSHYFRKLWSLHADGMNSILKLNYHLSFKTGFSRFAMPKVVRILIACRAMYCILSTPRALAASLKLRPGPPGQRTPPPCWKEHSVDHSVKHSVNHTVFHTVNHTVFHAVKFERFNSVNQRDHSVNTLFFTLCFTVWSHCETQCGPHCVFHSVFHCVDARFSTVVGTPFTLLKTLEFNTVKYTPHCEQSPHCETPTVDNSVDTLARILKSDLTYTSATCCYMQFS